MATDQTIADAAARWIDALNAGDPDVLDVLVDELFAPSYTYHHDVPGLQLAPGPAGVKQALPGMLATGWRWTVEDTLVDGDRLAIRVAVHRTDPETGKPQTAVILSVSHTAAGQYVDMWELMSSWHDEA